MSTIAKPVNAAMQYEGMTMRAPTKKGIKVIDYMNTSSILWFVTKRHRVGLLITLVHVLLGYIAYDKFLHIFF